MFLRIIKADEGKQIQEQPRILLAICRYPLSRSCLGANLDSIPATALVIKETRVRPIISSYISPCYLCRPKCIGRPNRQLLWITYYHIIFISLAKGGLFSFLILLKFHASTRSTIRFHQKPANAGSFLHTIEIQSVVCLSPTS
ncbi:hypothetical protein CPB86DRAFT_141168 [Serendipita vermifera]|nr:hypothetical protein CPB86DRAFT_141168 [Serendipita vermifera]